VGGHDRKAGNTLRHAAGIPQGEFAVCREFSGVANSMDKGALTCDSESAFVALVKPLEMFKGCKSTLAALFVLAGGRGK
jgi:hypothetical protein